MVSKWMIVILIFLLFLIWKFPYLKSYRREWDEGALGGRGAWVFFTAPVLLSISATGGLSPWPGWGLGSQRNAMESTLQVLPLLELLLLKEGLRGCRCHGELSMSMKPYFRLISGSCARWWPCYLVTWPGLWFLQLLVGAGVTFCTCLIFCS